MLTGDTTINESENEHTLIQKANIICTTPEKWDITTRKFVNNQRSIMQAVKLFLIDEIHVLGESSRGATIEAVVSRMKTLAFRGQNGYESNELNVEDDPTALRFVAISATIPNIDDIADWLGSGCKSPAIVYK